MELFYPAHNKAGYIVPPACEGVPVLREDESDGVDDACADGEQDYCHVKESPGGDEQVGTEEAVFLYVRLVRAGLAPEAEKVECCCKSYEYVENVEHVFRAEDTQEHEEIGEDGETVRGQADEYSAEIASSAVLYCAGAGVFHIERVNLAEEHHAYDCMRELMRECLQPFLVLPEKRKDMQYQVGARSASEPKIAFVFADRVYDYLGDVYDDQGKAEENEDVVEDSGQYSHNRLCLSLKKLCKIRKIILYL